MTYKHKIVIKAGNGIEVFSSENLPGNIKASSVLDFTSDREKFFFDNRVPYFHAIIHWLRYALDYIKISKKPLTFVFALSPDSGDQVVQGLSTVTEYLVERFTKMGHSVVFLNSDYAYVNNFVLYSEVHNFDLGSVSNVATFLSDDLAVIDEPLEKIYLSRGKTTTYNGNAHMQDIFLVDPNVEAITSYRSKNVYKFSDRVDDEKLVEDYFKSLGFKVVYPEDFPTYLDQLQTISSARILVSITSAGLVSSLVMHPGSVVVELSTPLEEGDSGTYRVHVHYRELSDVNRKIYISIPHRRVAEEIIDGIEKNLSLKEFLSS
jgi:hypothetical protein